ncbi:MAG: hypothetical protein JSV58_01045 [Candidatus Bathyarchaeota archaeon]|nr:MAG: hypothetical protein JSV58_01045 [Candidatus Bathyarchaeota archaeon]
MKVCVAGLGIIGQPVAEYIQSHGFQVYGFDLRRILIENVQTFTDWENVPKSDIFIIAVPSSNVETACRRIAEKANDALISVESTVTLGTCRRIAEKYGLPALVHCPHRFWEDEPLIHGVRQSRVIGALDGNSLERALKFYRLLDIPLHVCPTIETAEICKIAENAYRFTQIAFAEELRMICEEKGIHFDDVRKACNTKWNIEIPEARDGIYGKCLPQDVGFLNLILDDSPILDGAIRTDQNYKKWIRKR